jgi:hypothetical protein
MDFYYLEIYNRNKKLLTKKNADLFKKINISKI